jgi:cytochrome b561
MNAIAESRGSAVVAQATPKIERYDPVMKAMHWTTLFLVAAAYAVVWSSGAAATKEQQAVLVQVHRSLGVTIFALTLVRLAWRSRARLPSLPADLPAIQIMAARATQYLLYALLLAQPVLGLLHSIALGARIDLFFVIELPAMVSRDKVLSDAAISAHNLVANLMLVVVALHAAAALFHHFVRRDGVMKAMLPGARF